MTDPALESARLDMVVCDEFRLKRREEGLRAIRSIDHARRLVGDIDPSVDVSTLRAELEVSERIVWLMDLLCDCAEEVLRLRGNPMPSDASMPNAFQSSASSPRPSAGQCSQFGNCILKFAATCRPLLQGREARSPIPFGPGTGTAVTLKRTSSDPEHARGLASWLQSRVQDIRISTVAGWIPPSYRSGSFRQRTA